MESKVSDLKSLCKKPTSIKNNLDKYVDGKENIFSPYFYGTIWQNI